MRAQRAKTALCKAAQPKPEGCADEAKIPLNRTCRKYTARARPCRAFRPPAPLPRSSHRGPFRMRASRRLGPSSSMHIGNRDIDRRVTPIQFGWGSVKSRAYTTCKTCFSVRTGSCCGRIMRRAREEKPPARESGRPGSQAPAGNRRGAVGLQMPLEMWGLYGSPAAEHGNNRARAGCVSGSARFLPQQFCLVFVSSLLACRWTGCRSHRCASRLWPRHGCALDPGSGGSGNRAGSATAASACTT